MNGWVVFFIGLFIVFMVWQWSLFRCKKKYKWENNEIFILVLLFIAGMIDVFQTYFGIYVVQVAIELNQVFGVLPSILQIFLFKILLIAFIVVARPYFKANINKFIKEKSYLYVLLLTCIAQWFIVFCNEYEIYLFVYNHCN